ncbi:asparagine synthase-domain-containing protein [Dimargaris cristalligena]|uniref:Asparagine synthase-domain-containing protein n=1 Tax=Dimargaris cristalligena TaxID=215637 RepID=A0A4Q0A1X5_9FUNG|nr:asparagine synthase-domain-containing protein [Dimargaris cristalligena]|eukprot:RKP40064.1 asparagine synthase-domain-containing protein [Dimargaris cristalligena]
MCGILFGASPASFQAPEKAQWEGLKTALNRRGPDAQKEVCLTEPAQLSDPAEPQLSLYGYATVLHLRGEQTVAQPLQDPNNNYIFFWNGEVFDSLQVNPHCNDTTVVFDALVAASNNSDPTVARRFFLDAIQRVGGPFAFVFYNCRTGDVWFSRDCLGRRSLLWRLPDSDHPSFWLSSVICTEGEPAPSGQWQEVSAHGIYRLDTRQWLSNPEKFSESLTCYRWSSLPATPTSLSGISGIEAVPQLQLPYQSAFIGILRQALRERVETIPSTLSLLGPDSTRVAVLFSGGVDCLCLAALLHQILPPGEPIDLINVAFENPRTTQLPASSQGPKHRGSFYHGPPYQMTLPSGEVYLFDEKEYHRLFDVPDRLTGRASFRALAEWAPQRTWRFVAVNVPYSQVEVQRTRITQLMQPAHTVMDWSIALALWFAATGEGYLEPWQTEHEVPISPTIQLQAYRSPAPVLLLGMGADEQLGGYSKHRDRFEAQGWVGLVEEMQGQIDRIAIRNLGRDDRIISDHGKESRFPFLSHRVVDFLCSVPVHYKADLRFQRGIGEKILLRYALRQLGLPLSACQQWKKAIQFGARTAKMTSGKDKGTDKI